MAVKAPPMVKVQNVFRTLGSGLKLKIAMTTLKKRDRKYNYRSQLLTSSPFPREIQIGISRSDIYLQKGDPKYKKYQPEDKT